MASLVFILNEEIYKIASGLSDYSYLVYMDETVHEKEEVEACGTIILHILLIPEMANLKRQKLPATINIITINPRLSFCQICICY